MNPIRPLLCAFLVGMLTTAMSGHAQSTLFKCVDEKGVTHYGETMPAICAKKDVTEMSKQGRTVRKVDAPLTPEQQKARDIANAKQAEDDKKVADQRQKDLAMLGTYGSEREIDTLRDKDLAQVALRRKFLENRMADIDARLDKVKNLMEFYVAGRSKTAKAKDGKDGKDAKETTREVPPQLQSDFDRAQSDKANTQLEIDRLDKDKADVTARFEGEKERFRRLKNGMRPGTVLDDKGNVLIEPSLSRKPAPR
jgi:hypothetical protein